MRLGKTAWIAISGGIWFIVGVGLLTLGLNFIVYKAQMSPHETTSLIATFAQVAGGREQAALGFVAVGLLIGFIKGRFVLIKTVRRVVERIVALEAPIPFSSVYSKGYLLLIGGMILLGVSMKYLGLPDEVRGLIDVAIGSALMNGASAYFRSAFAVSRMLKKTDPR
jgi:hypothetical protein